MPSIRDWSAPLRGLYEDGRGNGWEIRWSPYGYLWRLEVTSYKDDEETEIYTEAEALAELSPREVADGEAWAEEQDLPPLFERLPMLVGAALKRDRRAA